jgi:preprotein translocase subunit YajC
VIEFFNSPVGSFVPFIGIFAVFYFLLIRPQQRRAKMHRDMVSAMQRGDKVITAGGLRAKVVKVVNETDVELEISPNVNVVVLKATVSDVIKS